VQSVLTAGCMLVLLCVLLLSRYFAVPSQVTLLYVLPSNDFHRERIMIGLLIGFVAALASTFYTALGMLICKPFLSFKGQCSASQMFSSFLLYWASFLSHSLYSCCCLYCAAISFWSIAMPKEQRLFAVQVCH